ncbi:MAG TPA: hypothetical protein DIW27_11980 [Cytophagales bacterium]|nr:hypothetical protein [Cytophagales bacterium]
MNSALVAHTYYRNLQLSTGRVDYDYVIDKFNQAGWVVYSYDNDENLSQVGEISLDYYTPDGLLDTAKSGLSQDQVTKFIYNSYGDVLTQTTITGTTQVHKMTLTYDSVGREKTKKEDIVGVTTPDYDYSYDSLGRLTEVKDGATTISQYTYDNNGNRHTSIDSGGSVSYTYDNQDRLTNAGIYTYTYSQNGERQSKTNTLTSEVTYYTYDSFGNLISVQLPNGDVVTYEIDALNRRVGKKKNGILQSRYIYMDALRIAAELDGSMQLKRRFGYATKSNIPDYYVEAGVKYRIISDQVGSPRLVFNIDNASIVAAMNHSEFGKVVANTNTSLNLPFGFAGGLWDEDTGLLRFGARDYDPETGRWTSKDPIGFLGGDTNLYAYVGGNPMSYIDPSGLESEVVIWEPTGWGSSSFGHISASINGTAYSFGPGGMWTGSSGAYNLANSFRNGVGIKLSLTPDQEKKFEQSLKGDQGKYNSVTNNCGDAVERGLSAAGVNAGNSLLPVSIGTSLLGVPQFSGTSFYTPINGSNDFFRRAPWAR